MDNKFGKALQVFKISPVNSVLAIILLALLLVLPASSWLFYKNIATAAHSWERSPKILLYLSFGSNEVQTQTLIAQIMQRPDVAKAIYISPLEGVKQLAQDLGFGEVLAKLSFNPLPSVIQVLPAASLTSADQVAKLADALRELPLVNSVQVNMNLVNKQYAYLDFWQKLFIFIIALSMIAVLLAMMQAVQVFQYLQKNSVIKNSIYFDGMILGLLAAVIAVLLTLVLFTWLSSVLQPMFGDQFVSVSGWMVIGWMMIGIALGFAGAWLARLTVLRPE